MKEKSCIILNFFFNRGTAALQCSPPYVPLPEYPLPPLSER